jgi:hypothetical protein
VLKEIANAGAIIVDVNPAVLGQTLELCERFRLPALALGVGCLSGLLFVRRFYKPQCGHCGYDCTGLAAASACPECGKV